jgi:hypothetical protein
MEEKKFYTIAEISDLKWLTIDIFHLAKKAYEKYPDNDIVKSIYDHALERMKDVRDIFLSLEDSASINKINLYNNRSKNIKGTEKLYVRTLKTK